MGHRNFFFGHPIFSISFTADARSNILRVMETKMAHSIRRSSLSSNHWSWFLVPRLLVQEQNRRFWLFTLGQKTIEPVGLKGSRSFSPNGSICRPSPPPTGPWPGRNTDDREFGRQLVFFITFCRFWPTNSQLKSSCPYKFQVDRYFF